MGGISQDRFRCSLIAAGALILAGCQTTVVVNVGGTVNVVPVIKANGDGCMTSATEAHEENPSTTTVKIPGVTP